MRAHDVCAAAFAERHPPEAARTLERLSPEEAGAFLAHTAAAVRGALLRSMSPAAATASLQRLSPADVERALTPLPGDIAASLLRRLPSEALAAVLAAMDAERRKPLERLLRFPEGTAGAIADVSAPVFGEHVTAAEARRRLRRVVEGAHPYVYVTDQEHRLVGVVHTRDLAAARPPVPLAELMQTEVASLGASAHLTTVAAHPAWLEFDPLPVVDHRGVFIGSVRHQRLRQAALPGAGASLTDSLLHLGELYWLGLAMLLPGLTAGASRPTGSLPHAEGTHGT